MEYSSGENIFHQYPILGFITTVILAAVGEIPSTWDYPAWFIHTFQIGAWCSAGGMFLIAAHGWYKKNFKK